MNVALRLLAEGLDVDMLTRVGRDSLGNELIRFLDEQGLPIRFVQIDECQPTGTVLVDTSNPAAARTASRGYRLPGINPIARI